MANLYSWLAMSHRSLVVVLYPHQQIISLAAALGKRKRGQSRSGSLDVVDRWIALR
jgi:hypothetical protein